LKIKNFGAIFTNFFSSISLPVIRIYLFIIIWLFKIEYLVICLLVIDFVYNSYLLK